MAGHGRSLPLFFGVANVGNLCFERMKLIFEICFSEKGNRRRRATQGSTESSKRESSREKTSTTTATTTTTVKEAAQHQELKYCNFQFYEPFQMNIYQLS
jgi:hypothetical protein